MDPVLTALFADGVARATGVGYDRASSALQKPRVSAKLDPLADEFHGSFKERLFDVADQLGDTSISRIAGYWEEIATDLDTNALGFDDEGDPVDVIVDAIYRHDYTDTTDLNRGNVHRAVSAAYAETLDEFCDQVAEDDELANRLNHHLGVQIVNKLDELRAVAADIEDAVKPTERYDLYRSDRVDLAVG